MQYKVKQNRIYRDDIQYYIDDDKFKNSANIKDRYYMKQLVRASPAYTKSKKVRLTR